MFGNFNKTFLMGRLTADPELRTLSNGGKLATFTIATSKGIKRDGKWVDETSFIDCKIFNRGESGKQADNIVKYFRKGSLIFVEGELRQERWETNNSEKRSKVVVYVDSFQVLESERADQTSKRQDRQEEYIPAVGPPDEDVPF